MLGKGGNILHNPTAEVGSIELKERACGPTPLFVLVFCLNFLWSDFLIRRESLACMQYE